jgi:hypothetical protein
MVMTITEVLNIWNEMGVFSYVIPFLLIFAVIYAILEKTEILGENKAIGAIVSVAVGLLALQFDFVSEFFAIIFPRFGVGLALFLTILIFLGFFTPEDEHGKLGWSVKWVGWVVGIGIFIWALSSWDQWSGQVGFGGWFVQNVWALIILGVVIGVIIAIAKSGKNKEGS